MTRERASELLSGVKVLDDPEMEEAHKMAISALMQQDVPDTDVGKKMTNADRIRAMSDMELAQWLASKIANLKFLDIEMSGKQLTSTEKEALTHDLYVVFGRYLKQPAEEDDHDERK